MSEAIAVRDPVELAGFNAGEDNKLNVGVPYFGIYGSKAQDETVRKLEAAGIEQNDFYVHDGLEPLRVKPFTCHLLRYATFGTKQDSKMQLTAVVPKMSKELWDEGFRDHLFILAAIRVGKMPDLGFIPAVGTFRSAMVKGFQKAIGLTVAAANPGWGSRTEAHAKSIVTNGQYQHPGGRVLLTLWSTLEEADAGDYNLSHGSTQPTPPDEAEAFVRWYNASSDAIASVNAIFEDRVSEARELI